MTRFLLGPLALLAIASVCLCQEPPPGFPLQDQVDQAEILRWGDRATIAGEGAKDAGELLFSMAMAPPADDSDQWYVSVFGTSSDAQTAGLVQAFERDPHLAAFIAAPPGEGKRPWAHFNVYYADDPMQKFRFEEYKLSGAKLPVVIVQPPRDGSFGGITTVTGADGKPAAKSVVIDRVEANQIGSPQALQKRIVGSVDLWCRKLAQSGFVPPAKVSLKIQREDQSDRRLAQSDSHGQTAFPWGPATPPAQPTVQPVFPQGGPSVVTVDPLGGLSALIPSMPTLLLILVAASNVFLAYRELRVKQGQPLIVPESVVSPLMQLIRMLSGQPPTPAPPAGPTFKLNPDGTLSPVPATPPAG